MLIKVIGVEITFRRAYQLENSQALDRSAESEPERKRPAGTTKR